MVSGMYLGEIVRSILCELISKNLLFGGYQPKSLFESRSFLTAYISAVESDPKEDSLYTRQVIEEFKVPTVTEVDCDIVKLVSILATRKL